MAKDEQAIIQALKTAADAATLASQVASKSAEINTATTVAVTRIETTLGFLVGQFEKITDAQKQFVTRPELEEVKKDFNKSVEEINKGFSQHNIDDKQSFGELKKIMYMGLGVLSAITFIAPFVIRALFNV